MKEKLILFYPHRHQQIVADVNSWKINDSPDAEFITGKVTLPQTLLLLSSAVENVVFFLKEILMVALSCERIQTSWSLTSKNTQQNTEHFGISKDDQTVFFFLHSIKLNCTFLVN